MAGLWPPVVAKVTPENVRFTCSSLHIVSDSGVRASENDMQTLTDYGSESARLLSNDLLNLRQTIRSMAKLNTLSFTTVTGLHRSIVDWWLRQEHLSELLQALPKSYITVEFDTAGYDRPLPEC